MSNIERDTLLKTMEQMRDLPVFVNDRISDVYQMRSAARTFVRTHKKARLLVVDYLQLAGVSTMRNDAQEREKISDVSRVFKQASMEFGIHIMELSQFSRESYKEGRQPTLSDLYGSGSIEKDADNVLMLHGEKPDDIITCVWLRNNATVVLESLDCALTPPRGGLHRMVLAKRLKVFQS
jgi:replicative DNA helicase